VILYDQPWVIQGGAQFFELPKQIHSPDLYLYYFVEFGYYWQGTLTLVFFDRHLSDFWVMLLHHISTLILVGGSQWLGYMRVGAVILWLHDCCDPILNLGKLFHYCKSEAISTLLFVVLILSWIVTRLILFMYQCVGSVMFDMPRDPFYVPSHHRTFLPILLFLYGMHWYWFYLMLTIVYRTWWKGEPLDDVRSDEERD